MINFFLPLVLTVMAEDGPAEVACAETVDDDGVVLYFNSADEFADWLHRQAIELNYPPTYRRLIDDLAERHRKKGRRAAEKLERELAKRVSRESSIAK